jgi:hypothetical protein
MLCTVEDQVKGDDPAVGMDEEVANDNFIYRYSMIFHCHSFHYDCAHMYLLFIYFSSYIVIL